MVVERAEKEYGEEFADIVKGYASQGNSKTLTAASMEISLSHFRTLLTKFNLHQYFNPSQYNSSCKGVGKGWPKGKKRGGVVRYSDMELLAAVKKHKTCEKCDQWGFPNSSTVRRRFGSWMRAKRILKEENYG